MNALLALHQLKVPLRIVLVVPFVLLLIATTVLSNFLFVYNSQRSVEELAQQMMVEVDDRVEIYLDNYLQFPHQINRSNANAVGFGQLDVNDLDAVERHLSWQISNLENVQDILYGNESGDFRIAEYLDGNRTIWVPDRPNIRQFKQYEISENGTRGSLISAGEFSPDWDVRQRPWYQLAKQKKAAVWSPVFTLGDYTDLAVNASLPVSQPGMEKIVGVFAVNLHLSRIDRFLQHIKVENSGIVLVVENDGNLIASSTDELPFTQTKSGEFNRLRATESKVPLIKAVSEDIVGKFNQWSQIDRPESWKFTAEGNTYFARVQPYQDEYGLSWQIVTVVPRSDFMEPIAQHTRQIQLLSVLAVTIAIAIGNSLAGWIVRPIVALSRISVAMAQGNWHRQIPDRLPILELDRMARSFNQMAAQLQDAFEKIQTNLRESETKYATIFRNSPDPISLTSIENGRWIDGNHSFFELTGYAPEEILNRTPEELNLLVYPHEAEAIARQIQETGAVKNQELHWRTKSGEVKVSLVSCEAIEIEGQPYVLGISKEIGELKQIEAALRESEARFSEIAATSDRLFFVRSASTGAFLYISPAYEQIWGQSHETLYLNPDVWIEAVHPEDRPLVNQSLRQQFQGNNIKREYRILRPDGEIRWIAAQINLVRDEGGNPLRFIGVAEDITDRKTLELALQRSEAKLTDIINSPLASIIRLQIWANREWKIDFLSAGCERIFGYSQAEFMKDKSIWMANIPPEDLETVILPVFEEIFAENSCNIEYRFYHKNGSVRWISATLQATYDRDANCWWVIQFAVDISDRKQAEAALAESKAQYQQIVETANEGIWTIDERDATSFVNPKMAEMLGYSVEEMLGQPLLAFMDAAEQAVAREKLQQRQQGIGEQHDLKFCRKDGSELWTMLSATPLMDEKGKYVGSLSMVTDISDRKRAELALQVQTQREQLLNQAIQAIHQSLDLSTIFSTATAGIAQLLDLDCAVIVRLDREREVWVHICAYRKDSELSDDFAREIPDRDNPFAERLKRGEAVIVDNSQTIEDPINQELARHHSGAWLLVPLKVNGTVWGSLSLWNPNPIPWSEENVDVARRVAEPLAIAIHQANLYHQSQQAEAALRESEWRLKLALEVSSTIAWERNLDTDRISFTGTPVGQAPTSLLYSESLALVHPDDIEPLHRANQRAIADRNSFEIEHRIAAPGETPYWRWFHVHAKVVTDAVGNPTRMIGMSIDITERKQTEAALQTSEARYRAILEDQTESIVRFSPDGRLTFVNEAYCRYFEKSREELLGHPYEPVIFEGDRELVNRLVASMSWDNPMVIIETRVLAGGEIRWTQWTNRLIFDDRKQVVEIQAVGRDIHDRKVAQEALQVSLNRLESLATAVPGNIYSLLQHPDGTLEFEYSNRALEDILEIPLERILDDAAGAIIESLHPQDRQDYFDKLERCTQTLESFKHQWRIITPSGQIKWLEGSSQPERRENGNIVWHGIVLDISHRKRAEEQIRQSQSALAEAQRIAHLGNWSLDLSSQTLVWSEETYRIYGFDPTRPTPSYEQLLQRIHPEEVRDFQNYVQQAISNGKTSERECRILLPDGSVRYLYGKVKPICDASGKVIQLFGIVQDITPTKLAQQELLASEEKFRQLAENIHEVFFILSAIGEMIYISPAYAEIWDRSCESLYQNPQSWFEFVHPEDRERAIEAFDRQIALNTDFDEIYRILRPNGEIRWIHARSFSIENQAGVSSRFVGIAEDITERKQAEVALQESESTLRSFFNSGSMLMGIVELYPDDILHLADNLNTAQFFGTVPEAMQNRFATEMGVSRSHLEMWLGYYREAERINAPVRFEYVDRTTQGERWLSVSVCPISRHSSGRTRCSYIAEDITDRKRAELALQERETMLRTLGDNLDKGLIYQLVREPDGRYHFSYISAGIKRLVGLEPEAVIEDSSVLYNLMVEEERLLNQTRIEESFRDLSPYQIQMRKRTPNGEIQWSQLRSMPRRMEDGRTIWDGIEVDITDLKNIEAELKQAKEAAESANQAKSEFLANMSHEIRTPMNAILGFCDILNGMIAEPQHRSYLQTIATSGQTLLSLINDILDLSKIESGKLDIQFEALDFYALIWDIQQIFSQKAIAKKILLKTKISPNFPTGINFDEVRIRQILFNVVGNAIKFTERGSITIELKSKIAEERRSDRIGVEIIISDTGIGIAPEQQERIFEAFIQSDGQSTRKYGGTGLGLAITKRLTEMLGGTVHLQSTLGEGSTFTFTFPNVEVATTAAKTIESGVILESFDRFQPATILVVDDVQSNLDLIAGYFAGTRHSLIFARNGREAIQRAIADCPDLILLDLWMPELNGIDAAKFIKEHEQTRQIPIVIVTASARAQDEEIVQSLCDGFLRKPMTRSQLISELEKVLPLKEDSDSIAQLQASSEVKETQILLPKNEAEMLSKRPELLERLRQEKETVWPQLCKTMKRHEIEQFSDRLYQLAREYHCQSLLDYATTLQTQLAEFDWENLPDTVERFPEVCDSLGG